MKQLLFSALHRPDRSPSQRFRFDQYMPYLLEHNWQTTYSYLINAKDDVKFYAAGNYFSKVNILLKSLKIRLKEKNRLKKFDAIFVQREAFMLGTSFFEKKYAKAKAPLIFDFDDAIWLQNVSKGNQKLSFLKNPNKTATLVKIADTVIAGNSFLADYAKQYNNNVHIIPTCLDTAIYQPKIVENTAQICIGWSGSFSTIAHFELILPVLKLIKEKYKDRVRFLVVGDANYQNKELGINGLAWSKESEQALISQMDIGIMPLPDDQWAKGKCGFKGLLYMSMGVPAVMADVGMNKEIVQNGSNGFLAKTENDWFSILCDLIEDHTKRKNIGQQGRKTVVEKFSVQTHAPRLLSCIETGKATEFLI